MVDWSLARQVARLAAGSGDEGPPQADVAALCAEMDGHVAELHGPVAGHARARARAGRPRRVGVGEPRLAREAARPGRRAAGGAPRVRRPAGRRAQGGAAATVAAEAGLVIGYVAQRVLGQYEVSLLGGDAPAAAAVRRAQPAQGGARAERRPGALPPLDLRPRADPRLPVPGRRLAARPPRRDAPARTCRRSRCGSSAAPPAGCRRCRTRRSWSRPSATAGWPRSCRPRSSAR